MQKNPQKNVVEWRKIKHQTSQGPRFGIANRTYQN